MHSAERAAFSEKFCEGRFRDEIILAASSEALPSTSALVCKVVNSLPWPSSSNPRAPGELDAKLLR